MNADQVRAFVSACWPQAMQSPLAMAVRAVSAAHEAERCCVEAACGADDTGAMLADAEVLADTWRHLGFTQMREQVDAHLESNWPEAAQALREQLVSRVCSGHHRPARDPG